MAERIGTPLQGPVRIKSTLTPKPIAYSNEIAGGPWNVGTIAQRNAIQTFYRRDDANAPLWGSTCYVHSDPVSANNGRYELVRGLVDNNIDNNDNWQKVSSGTGGSSYTAAQIRDLYESNPDRNAFTDAEKTKLAGISGMTPAQIRDSYESNANRNAYTDAEKAKLALQSGSNSGDETDQSILGKLLNNPGVNIVTDAEKAIIGSTSGVNTGDETPEAVLTKLLSNENVEQYTTAEKDKLAGLEDAKWKGSYTNLAGLQSAYPVGEPGWEADVDAGVGDPVQRYIWDESDQQWEAQVGTSTSETAASVKAKYESNPNTNEYSDGDKAKVTALSGTNTGDETPASVKTKLLQNPDTNNFGDAEVLKLSNIESNATADQTAPEIRNLLNTLIGDDRLPHTSVKGLSLPINNLTSSSTENSLAAAQGPIIKGLIDNQFYLGAARWSQGEYNDGGYHDYTISYNGFSHDKYFLSGFIQGELTFVINFNDNGNSSTYQGILFASTGGLGSSYDTLQLPVGHDSENKYITVRAYWVKTLAYRYTRRDGYTHWEYLGGGDEPATETTTNPNIVSSRDVWPEHAGANFVNPVVSSSAVDLTVQPESTSGIRAKFTANYAQDGTGKVNIVAGTGVTIKSIRNSSNQIRTASQYSLITLVYEGNDIWRCFGSIETT